MKKLIRTNITSLFKKEEWKVINDKKEINDLYILKVQEELKEIQNSNYKDISEYADLLQVVRDFARMNGFDYENVEALRKEKENNKGRYENIVLTNLNPENPSNHIYFKQPIADYLEACGYVLDYKMNKSKTWQSTSVFKEYKDIIDFLDDYNHVLDKVQYKITPLYKLKSYGQEV